MALSKLSGDEQCIISAELCNPLDPGIAVALSSVSNELRMATRVPLQQLKTDHEAATVLVRKAGGMGSCKELRKARSVICHSRGFSSDDLALLGKLGSVLPALECLYIMVEPAVGPDGAGRLFEKLGAGALPALVTLYISNMHVGDTGCSALSAAIGRGALPRLESLSLMNADIGDVGLVALAPALWRLPVLKRLLLDRNPLSDDGIAALVAPPPLPPAGVPAPLAGALKKLGLLSVVATQVGDAGCATLAAALNSGTLPAIGFIHLRGTRASDAARAAVQGAVKDVIWKDVISRCCA